MPVERIILPLTCWSSAEGLSSSSFFSPSESPGTSSRTPASASVVTALCSCTINPFSLIWHYLTSHNTHLDILGSWPSSINLPSIINMVFSFISVLGILSTCTMAFTTEIVSFHKFSRTEHFRQKSGPNGQSTDLVLSHCYCLPSLMTPKSVC